MTRWLLALPLLVACNTDVEGSSGCEDLCTELQVDCAYQAYPSFESCLQGCQYAQEEQGADIRGELTCVQEADCNTFEILECEHAYGAVE